MKKNINKQSRILYTCFTFSTFGFCLLISMLCFTNFCFAKEWITESSGFLKNISVYKTSKGSEYKIFTINGHFKDNVGIYGISDCSGYREVKDNELLFLKVVCEFTTQHGDKFITIGERQSLFNEAGVGSITHLDGTGVFKQLIGNICVYAVNKVLSSDFVVTKCQISDTVFKKLKDYSEK